MKCEVLKTPALFWRLAKNELRMGDIRLNNRVNALENEISCKLKILDQSLFNFPGIVMKLETKLTSIGTTFFESTEVSDSCQDTIKICDDL